MLKKGLKLSAPWVILYRKIEAMFKEDPQVNVVFDEDEMMINLYVNCGFKAAALDDILVPEYKFGNTTVKVIVIPPNDDFPDISKDPHLKYDYALGGNWIFNSTYKLDHPALPHFTYVMFEPNVAQYFTDDLTNPFGVTTTLYEDIAKEIFRVENGVFFSTVKKRG